MKLTCQRLLASAIAVAALSTPAADGASASAGKTAAAGAYRILLTSNRDGETRTYSMLPDSSRLTPLLPSGRVLEPAAVSRDGTTITYTERGSAIYVSRSDGTGLRRLVPRGVFAVEGFSPNGKLLAFSTDAGLRIVGTNGRGLRRVTSYGDDGAVDWAPDGKSLVFARYNDDGSYAIIVQPLRGRRRVVARTGPNYGAWPYPGWSPDGRWIAYVILDDAERQNGVWVVRRDGKQRHRVTPRVDSEGSVGYEWSPDGRWLATDVEDSNDERKNGLWLLRPSGKDRHRLTADLDTYEWSPDGRRLAFVTTSHAVVVVGPDGSGSKRLKLDVQVVWALLWSPDGRRLAVAARAGEAIDHIWTFGSDLSGLRRVTSEGSNELVGWTRLVPVLPEAPPVPPTERVVRADTVATRAPVAALSADGPRVAFVTQPPATDCDHVAVWAPGADTVVRFGRPQAPCSGDPGRIVGLALAGSRVAWAEQSSVGSSCDYGLKSATLADPRWLAVYADPGSPCGVEDAYHLRGDGDLLVFNGGSALIRIGSGSEKCEQSFEVASICTTLRRGDHASPVDAVSGRSIAIRERGAVAVVDDQGRLVRVLPFAPADVSAARLDGSSLVVWRFGVLEAYDVATGALELSRPLPSGFRLADVDGGVAVLLSTDKIMLLRLADGRSLTLAPGREPTLADLEPPGLYYSYATSDGGGRLVFVPRSEILGQLR